MPRIMHAPPALTSGGSEAVDLAGEAGLLLDPWQQLVLDTAMREDPYGKWVAMEVGLCVPRQNGKGAILTARHLVGLYLLHEYIVHTAHQFETSLDAFRRLVEAIESNPVLLRKVAKIYLSHGEEGIRLKTGGRIKFKTRTKSGGRGLSGDLVVLDEAMILTETSMGTLMPLLSSRANPQLWYTGSAVDLDIHDAGYVFGGVRARGLKGNDPSLVYMEWSCEEGADPRDPREIARSNPAYGIRISPEYVVKEFAALRALGNTYAVERMGVGNWPKPEELVQLAIDSHRWKLLGVRSTLDELVTKSVCLAVDMTPDMKWVTIAAAVLRTDGRVHVEIGYHRAPVTREVVAAVVGLVSRLDPCAVVIDRQSPAMSLVPELREAKIEPELTNAPQMVQACVGLSTAVADGEVRHTGDPLLQDAVDGAQKRDVGTVGWAFSRIGAAVISPLVAAALARWGLKTYDVVVNPPPPPQAVAADDLVQRAVQHDVAYLLGTADLGRIGF